MLKKHSAILSAVFGIVFAPIFLGAQQPAPAQRAKSVLQTESKVSVLAIAESIPNLNNANDPSLKSQLKQYHDCTCTCGCYENDLNRESEQAIAYLRDRAAHPRKPGEKMALVLDIDETSLSNYEEMAGADFGYDAKAFNDWIESAKAPAIQGTLNIYREARRLGVFVFFITGRDESQRAATEKNLKSQGFQKWERLIMRTPEQKSETALKYKSGVRSGLNGEGFQIVLSVGDQWSDLGGKPEAELSVKYPDPFYFIQ